MTDPEHLGGFIHGGDDHSFTPWLWARLLERFKPLSLLDVGCGEGHAVKWFLEHGVDAYGVDGSEVAKAAGVIPEDRFLVHDFTTGPFPRAWWSYDLVWSCEFIEHLEEQHLPNALATLGHGLVVAMTAAAPWQGGHHHVNAQEMPYWIEKMEGIGFRYEKEFTEQTKHVPPEVMKTAYWGISGMVFTRTR